MQADKAGTAAGHVLHGTSHLGGNPARMLDDPLPKLAASTRKDAMSHRVEANYLLESREAFQG